VFDLKPEEERRGLLFDFQPLEERRHE
jgi:hypothetical protein